ncbi:MAG: nucleotidyltransferase family protein [Gemmatimonadota bacterium]
MGMPAVYGVVLAAGRSSRFGSNKLLATYRGKPLIEPVLATVAHSTTSGWLSGGLAVAVPGNPDLDRVIAHAGLGKIDNDEPEAGLSHSLRLALDALGNVFPDADGALIFMGDQPGVRSSLVQKMVATWRDGAGPFVRPRYLDDPSAPGHPVLIDREVWDLAGSLSGDAGFGPLLKQYPELVTILDVPGTNPDIDTPDDLHRLAERS